MLGIVLGLVVPHGATASWTQALWLIVPAAFLLGLIALILRYRIAIKEAERGFRDDKLHVYRHGAALDREPALLLLEEPNGGDGGNVHEENKGRPISARDGV